MAGAALLLLLSVGVGPAQAWTELRSDNGLPLRLTAGNPWRDEPYLPLVGNPDNSGGVAPTALQDAVVDGLLRWQHASDGAFAFDYWQGSDTWIYPPRIDRDGVSTVFFASGADAPLPEGLDAVAWTEVWYDDLTGEIQEVDIMLDDRLFDFSGEQPELDVPVPDRPAVDLHAVVAHELGHALGLDHAGVAYGTMLPWIWPGQDELGCDDIVGVREIYGTTGQATATVLGEVTSDAAEGLPPQVSVISLDDGLVRAAVLAEGDAFTVRGLPEGRYALMVEPFLADRDALGGGYVDAAVGSCADGAPPPRSLVQDAAGLRTIHAIEGGVYDVGQLDLPCQPSASALPAAQTLEDAPALSFDGDGHLVWTDRFTGLPGVWHLRLDGVEGALGIDLLGPSLYSAARVTPSLLDSEGEEVATQVSSPRWDSGDGFVNWNATLLAEDLTLGHYFLRLEVTTMPGGELPGGEQLLDAQAFVLMSARTGDSEDALARQSSTDTIGGTCTLTEPLAAYDSPDTEPPRREVHGGCGSGGSATSSAIRGLGLFGLFGLRRRRRADTAA